MQKFIKRTGFILLLSLFIPLSGLSQTVIWQNDFSDPFQWAISNFTGDQQNWVITNSTSTTMGFGTGAWQDQTNTISNENGYALFDSDSVSNGNGQDAIITYNGSIDLSMNTDVSLVFNQRIRTYITTQTFIEISIDGGVSWNSIQINQDKTIGVIYEETANINISSIAGGQSNVMIRFRFIGVLEYLWMIDDVKLQVPPLNDLSLNNLQIGSTGFWGARMPYYQIPINQIVPIEISAGVSNYGLNDQGNVVFSASVPEAGFSSSSSATTLVSYQTDFLATTSNFIPPAQLGYYTVNASVTGNPENNLSNNSLVGPTFKITNNIYARDKGIVDGSIGYQGQAFEVGNVFDIFTQATLEGIQFYVHPNATVGSNVYVKLYSYDPNTGGFLMLSNSDNYTLTSSDIGQFLTLPLTAPFSLNANEGYIAIVGTDGNFAVGKSGFSDPFTTYLYDSNNSTWYYTTSTPMVRMVLNSSQEINASICQGDTYTFNNQTYTEPGFYLQTLSDQVTMDSVIAININYLTNSTNTINATTACGPFELNGQQYSIAGQYTQIVSNQNGCDSTIILNLFDYDGSNANILPANCGGNILDGSVSVEILNNLEINNQIIEIYNGSDSPYDLGADYGDPSAPYTVYFKLRNASNQVLSFPPSTIIQPHGTLVITNPNSSIQGDLESSVIDGSTITMYYEIIEFGIQEVWDVANTNFLQTAIRKDFITFENANYNASEWDFLPFNSSSIGSHTYSNDGGLFISEYYSGVTIIDPGYTIEWNDGTIGNSLNGIAGGDYTYTVSLNGCVVETNTVEVPWTGGLDVSFSSTQQLFTAPPFAVQFTNSSNAQGIPTTYTWDFGDGTSLTSNNTSVFHQYLFNGLYTVTLVATNNLTGCSDTTTISDYIFCTGGVSCTHMATINEQGPVQACQGTDVWLTCNNDPSFTYQWRRNGVNINGNNNDSLLVTQSGVYTVIILVNNCPVTSNSVNVNIFPAPPAPVITANGAIVPCVGGSVTLNTGNYTTYNWSTGATTQSIDVTNSGTYNVVVNDVNGCESSSADFVLNTSFVSPPSVCVVGMDSLTNENRVVWEKPLTLGIDSFYVYKETNVSDFYTKIGATDYDELAVFLDANSNPAVQAYRYKITALDTCGTETNLSDFHKTIHLTINAGVGGAWNLIWSHYEGLTFGSYNIYRGTDPTNISLLTTIQSNLNSYTDLAPPVGPVYYQIEIVNPNSCDPTKVVNYSVSKSNIVNNGVNGINALANSTVHVYPNPTSKDVTLEITDELIGKDYFLTDNTGRIILSGQFRALKETVNLEQIATGVYFIKIDNNANL
ncbi:MAG: PKD domain-containing protein, partial [Crocinitomicaceae bacterium]|nr:PKD domain-containing protein [Crocinitomicaceae bacterium]